MVKHLWGSGRLLLPLLFLTFLAACGEEHKAGVGQNAAPSDAVAAFLRQHWARPLASQGAAPARFSPLEASLDAKSCGTCHVEQYRDWQTALHAATMGPGLLGQLMNMEPNARDEHQDCLRCHAPLAEQADSLVSALGRFGGGTPAAASEGLHARGLICAGCHVRGNERFGPPRRDGSAPSAADRASLPHGGWTASAAFEDSRFCGACHQFEADGFALNGKLLENTVEEWKASAFAAQGKTCQSCHMPERRHLWRGVHDAEMVKRALAIEAGPLRLEPGKLVASLRLRNVGAGHYFPTYVTPRVVAEIFQEDAKGAALPGTASEHVIERQVAPDLSREIADTRLAPGAEALLAYDRPLAHDAVRMVYRVRVEPDAFYTTLYESLLADGSAGRGSDTIRDALARSRKSRFVLYEERRALPKSAS